jgi:hypothetical protein
MKRLVSLILFVLVVAVIISCEDEVNPKTDLKDIYSMNCIIRGDTSFQVATITRSYDVSGFDPGTNKNDPFIKGAKIKLLYQNGTQTFFFRDTTMTRPAGSNYSTPLSYYYLKNFQPTFESPISIEATLPNGKVLTAKSITFYISPYAIQNNYYSIPSSLFGNYLVFNWVNLTSTRDETVYYVPELIIKYARIQNNVPVEYQKKVPLFYIQGDNGEIPLYPPVQANLTSANFDTTTIRKSITEISAGDPNKGNYIIRKAVFRLLIADKNLAMYYAAQKTFLDEFSVRVTQPEFSNIQGGLGIFGTLNSTQIDVPIKESYIRSFGYKPF